MSSVEEFRAEAPTERPARERHMAAAGRTCVGLPQEIRP